MINSLVAIFTTMTDLARRNVSWDNQEISPASLETLASTKRPSRIAKQLETLIQKVVKAIFPAKLAKDPGINSNNTLHDQTLTAEPGSSLTNVFNSDILVLEQYKRAEKFRKAFLKTEEIYWHKIEIDFKTALKAIGLEVLLPEFEILLRELKNVSDIFETVVKTQQELSAETKSSLIAESRLEWKPV